MKFQFKEIVQWFLAWTETFTEYTVPRSATYMKTGHGHVRKEKPNLRTVILLSTLSKYLIYTDDNDMISILEIIVL